MDTLYPFLIVFALILDKLLGEMPTRYHPVVYMGKLAELAEKLLLVQRVTGKIPHDRERISTKTADLMYASNNKDFRQNISSIDGLSNLHNVVPNASLIDHANKENDFNSSLNIRSNHSLSHCSHSAHSVLQQIRQYIAGAIGTFIVIIPFALLPFFLTEYVYHIDFIDNYYIIGQALSNVFAFCIAGVCVYICIAPRSLAEHAMRVCICLEKNNLIHARLAVSHIVGRNTAQMDVAGVSRACIESVSENVTDGVFSSIFWATVGLVSMGFSGAVFFVLLHRSVNVLDAMWGKRNEKYCFFGTFAARLDDVLNYFPARLSLFVISLSTFFTKNTSFQNALRIGYIYRYAHVSPNSAWSEAAFAGALGLKLGGPVNYAGFQVEYPYFGEGTLLADPSHIRLAIRLMWSSVLVFASIFTLIIYFLY